MGVRERDLRCFVLLFRDDSELLDLEFVLERFSCSILSLLVLLLLFFFSIDLLLLPLSFSRTPCSGEILDFRLLFLLLLLRSLCSSSGDWDADRLLLLRVLFFDLLRDLDDFRFSEALLLRIDGFLPVLLEERFLRLEDGLLLEERRRFRLLLS